MNWFKRSMLVGALAAALGLPGCAPQGGPGQRASGSLALTSDDALLYAVDTDNAVLVVIDTRTQAEVAQVKVGVSPARVLVGPDDTAFVTNRGDRSVSVIRRGDSAEATRLQVGVEPTGMAMTPDGKTLLVVSATSLTRTDVGTLTAFDTGTLEKKWEVEVGEEPRAVAVVAGDRALVSLFKEGEIVEVNLKTAQVTTPRTGIYTRANASRLADTSSGFGTISTFRSRAMSDLVVTPAGDRVFAPVVWAREDSIGRRPSSAGGYYSAGGPCNIGSVATAGIVTVDVGNRPEPQVDDLTSCFTTGTNSAKKDFPPSTLASSGGEAQPIQGPTVGVVDPTGEWLLVLSRESRNLAFLPAYKREGTNIDFESTGTSVRTVQDVGHGADGLAVTRDFSRAYVYNQFDHSVQVFEGQGAAGGSRVVPVATLKLNVPETLTPDEVAGRKMFFDARDTRLSSAQTTVACSTCHLEGREDGHVWQFPDGPRQTPMLGGRKLLSTAPYHWSGEFAALKDFNVHTITERMGGRGLSLADQQRLDLFLDRMAPPDNAVRTATAPEVLARGKAAFVKAECGSCHSGELLTNNTNADVGTLRLTGRNPDNGLVVRQGFNVPSLLGLGRSAPYLHDGTQVSLEERVFSNPGDLHGVTSTLSAQEKADLVVYLKSL